MTRKVPSVFSIVPRAAMVSLLPHRRRASPEGHPEHAALPDLFLKLLGQDCRHGPSRRVVRGPTGVILEPLL